MLSKLDLAALKSSADLSFASHSLVSSSLREYYKYRVKASNEFQFMLTDLRDKKTPIEADAGRIFNIST